MVLFTFYFFGEGRGQTRETIVRLGHISQRCVSQVSCTGRGQGSVSGWISPGNRSRNGQPALAQGSTVLSLWLGLGGAGKARLRGREW